MTRPWEEPPLRPWELQQPVYARTVSVRRSKTVAGGSPAIGLTGYSGREQSTASSEGETIIATGLPAQIQARRAGRVRGTMLPGDVADRPEWLIHIPAASIAQYTVRDRDIIVDDEGYRYEVASNYWTSFGYELTCLRMET